jgi:4-hydroxy-3-methylbut-2-enyl diphosphate reductase
VVKRVVLVSPRGFCAGVVRAIAIVERTLLTFGRPVYVRRAIVHNGHVVDRLRDAGAIFVDEVDEVPEGGVVVLSAHGAPAVVRARAIERGLTVVDATCPLVAKVHREVRRFHERALDVVLIGHQGDDEVIGTLGQAPSVRLVESVADAEALQVPDPSRLACVTQTTLSQADLAPLAVLRSRFPGLTEPGAADVCYATTNRQAGAVWLAETTDAVLVVGDAASSNARRLCQVARLCGTPAHLIPNVHGLRTRWIRRAEVVGVTAGASTPEALIAEVVRHLCRQGATVEETVIANEHLAFALPDSGHDDSKLTTLPIAHRPPRSRPRRDPRPAPSTS